jgi:hypothetical protein
MECFVNKALFIATRTEPVSKGFYSKRIELDQHEAFNFVMWLI